MLLSVLLAEMFPGAIRLLPFTVPVGTGLCPKDPGGGMESVFCRSPATKVLYRISAGQFTV